MKYKPGDKGTDWNKRKTMKVYNYMKKRLPRTTKRVKRVLRAEGVKIQRVEHRIKEDVVEFIINRLKIVVPWEDATSESPRQLGEKVAYMYIHKVG